MTHEQLQRAIMLDFNASKKPLTEKRAMELVRARLKDYPKQLQEFGDWFQKNADLILERVNG